MRASIIYEELMRQLNSAKTGRVAGFLYFQTFNIIHTEPKYGLVSVYEMTDFHLIRLSDALSCETFHVSPCMRDSYHYAKFDRIYEKTYFL